MRTEDSPRIDPIRPTDDLARAMARDLVAAARFGALGVLDETGAPRVTRIAVGRDADGVPMTLVSGLSAHSVAIRRDPRVSLLIGEPGRKGDPLTHPRLTLFARAVALERSDPDHAGRAARWLSLHPKAKLYIGFGDFFFVRLEPVKAHLNGGFGRAFHLAAGDIAPGPSG